MFSIQRKGIYLSLLAAVISGVSIFINKFAVDAIKNPLVFTSVKNAGVGIFIVALLIITKKWQLIKKLTRTEIKYLVLIGIVGGSIPFYLFFTGLSQIPASNAAIIQKTLVLWTAVLAIPFLKERFTKAQILGVLLILAGNLFIGGFKGFTYSSGELLILLATILWAVESIIAKKVLKTLDSEIVAAARMVFGSALLLIATLVTNPGGLNLLNSLNSTQWMWLILTAVSLAAYVLTWYKAMKFAPVIVVSSVLVFSTLITNILSAIFVTHTWNLVFTPQSALIAVGVLVFVLSTKISTDKKLNSL